MTGPGLKVIRPGPLTLIQDLGRIGQFRQGLTVGGPADRLAFLWANRLCGNRANTAALEIVLGGALFQATDHCQVVVAGGGARVRINDTETPSWCGLDLAPGDHLEVPPLSEGLRTYLAVRGGVLVEPSFGSSATVCRERIGGLNGGPLQQGDFLPAPVCHNQPRFHLPASRRPASRAGQPLRLVVGWQYHELPPAMRRDLFARPFRVSVHSDRMGLRLEGAPLADHGAVRRQMVSEGILAGALQIPPDGQPIVMLNDHQTMGGYPKAGTVLSCDLWQMSQLRPEESVTFSPISSLRGRAIARRLMREFEATAPIRA